ncbi:proto-oncogene tyrosine-protein kinase ROS-like isoform X2 [Ruditapes philippinarum]|uniref:proto-oncogene tyrosine-protein kinase ROS-like isoform X2 n=1 Tax=Ruditapes philippinarum TaxID=129788 RepID=UPI00295B27D7|nr:proto-oncogene tyrosine-protein kinase ROS-like isoform X2 [Ruditapes philippinarum]
MNPTLCGKLFLTILSVILNLLLVNGFIRLDSIDRLCKLNCDHLLVKEKDTLYCDNGCQTEQCYVGCSNYGEAISDTPCSTVCTDLYTETNTEHIDSGSTVQTQKQSCVKGCNFGLEEYHKQFVTYSGLELPGPEIVRDGITHNSVLLDWAGESVLKQNTDPTLAQLFWADEELLRNITFILQKRVLETETEWQSHSDMELMPSGRVNVTSLHPFVTYQFKFIFQITTTHAVETNYSVPVTTLPYGVPSGSPRITSLHAPSSSTVSVSWVPPVYSNGPLINYRLSLYPLDSEDHVISSDVTPEKTSWIFGHLSTNSRYEVRVSAMNGEGEGPAAVMTVKTPMSSSLKEKQTPYLILGAENCVVKQNLEVLAQDAKTVLKRPKSILTMGVGVHVKRELVLVSDDSGQVTLVNIDGETLKEDMYPMLGQPTAIDVDWLHNKAYVIDGHRIYQCTIIIDDWNQCIVALDLVPNPPHELKVDPINGYLYYTLSNKAGLYSVPLIDFSQRSEPDPTLVIPVELQTFFIDYENLLLFYPNNTHNTVMSAYLDGTGVTDMRQGSVARPHFLKTESIVYYDEKFFWTNGSKVFSEAFDLGNRTYYHHSLAFWEKHFTGFNLYYPNSQPVPVPLNAPGDVQVLFTAYKAIVEWTAPEKLIFQGEGAYSQWLYDVSILQDDGSKNEIQETSQKKKFVVSNLEPDTIFQVKVRAKSSSGAGPWSTVFHGRTLKAEFDTASLVVAVQHQHHFKTWEIKEVGLDGEVINVLFQTSPIYPGVTDLAWHEDKLFWTTNDKDMFVYLGDEDEQKQLDFIQDATCVAFDWLGQRLYWSVLRNGDSQIRRADIYGDTEEFVYQALARDMTLDSVKGRLYWVTEVSVETTFLNGNDHLEYFSLQPFSGRQVISLTIDHDHQKLMWYVKGFEDQSLYMADLYSNHGNYDDLIKSVSIVGKLQDIERFSAIQYYSHHLMWVDEQLSLRVGDSQGNFTASISAINAPVSVFTLKHKSLHRYPESLDSSSIIVIPSAIRADSITCIGLASKFNVTWQPSNEVNHGHVTYKLSVKAKGIPDIKEVVSHPWFTVQGLAPYTPISISVQAHTYWGSGPQTVTTVKSPMAAPSEPISPKVYVTQRKNAALSKLTLAADFRWSEPAQLNGVLSKQIVWYWQSDKPSMKSTTPLPQSARHFILDDLKGNVTYFFQVECCTPAGCGPKSQTVSATADAVNPVPKVLIATKDDVRMAEADNVQNTSVIMARKSVVALSYLSQDDKYYWITRDKYLEQFPPVTGKKLLHLDGGDHKMCLDWVSRTVYAVDSNMSSAAVISYNLDEGKQYRLIERKSKVGDIAVDPYTSSLLWTEYNAGESSWKIIRTTTNDPSNLHEFFNHPRHKRNVDNACNCPAKQRLASAVTVDLSADGHTEILYVDITSMSLMASDMEACTCRTFLTTTPSDRKGLPADIMTVDHVYIYWYHTSSQILYVMDKATGNLQQTALPHVTDIQAYGAHLHPLPGSECLDTNPYKGEVGIVMYTNTSIKVNLSETTWPVKCTNISHPAVRYTVYYRQLDDMKPNDDCQEDKSVCQSKSGYSRELSLDQLEPYTYYIIQGAVSNYYSKYTINSLGNATEVRTKPGVPSPVENITAQAQSPDRIKVWWPPPEQPNGPVDKIVYFVKWSTQLEDGILHTTMTDAITFDSINPFNNRLFEVDLEKLSAEQTYSIQVISNQTEGNFITESVPVICSTYQAPNDLECLEVTNTSIQLAWTSPSDDSTRVVSIYYAEVKDKKLLKFEMIDLPIRTFNNTMYNETFADLKPDTEYSFRLSIIYKSYSVYEVYHWPKEDSDLKYVFRTLTGIPDSPASPEVQEFKGEFEVSWPHPEDNGETIMHYLLQYKYIDKDNWSVACNTSELRWVIDDNVLQRGYTYMFRVKAKNKNGWGPYSLNSTMFSYPILEAESEDRTIIVVAVVVAFVVVVIAMATVAICYSMCRKRREEKKKKKNQEFVAVARGPDLELATLRELPMTHIQQNNTLYAMNLIPTDDEIAALPHFRRDQLVLCKFLGSGAFGEVFEGIAKNIINESSGDTRCAVKTLRKSASDQEKEEFLKEALLMSNFHHEHILSLLGVCLDNDPQFIILELMEGGDLLSFMRACRLTSIQNQSRAELSMTDLVKICVHVASGCKYLEDMHFVHRDLAARNCLVSSCDPNTMVVKIGDFGLARDIYKNDYYRKEGEGLLPVRWMSPESLVDGVFTTQSDIWAFGVLMWEVVTFGQQPYPARTNIDVLHFVRSAGRLDRPESCPEDFYQLMCKCWSFEPEDRPSFAFLLQKLEKFHETCLSISEYLVPICSSNRSLAAVAGYKYLSRRTRRLTSTSSDGPEYSHINHTGYGTHKSYGNIRRATSFDSPEPKDATEQVQTDSANYLEPKSNYVPSYIEFLPEERTVNYMYNSEGNRIREKGAESIDITKKVPNYVQTTVKENFHAQGQDYIKYVNQKSSSISDQENDSEVKKIFSHQKNSADSVIMKTVENIPNSCRSSSRGTISTSSVSCSDSVYPQNVNSAYALVMQNGGPRTNGKKRRLDSTNSVMSFDSVQTEPVYSSFQRGKLYSSSSSKSNYSMSNISETTVEQLSPDTEPKKFWANTSVDCANLVDRQEAKTHVDYFNMAVRNQVYPENIGTLSGYDIVHASLV